MTYPIQEREHLPTEFQILLADYPRDSWPEHPNFATSIRSWLGAHRMFRNLGKTVTRLGDRLLSQSMDPQKYGDRMSYYGNQLVGNLHGHHSWEDSVYFPELKAADPRFEKGLDMLESDHTELHHVIELFTDTANQTLQQLGVDEKKGIETARVLLDHSRTIQTFLQRHLADEEDLVVPILLHHKMRG